MRSILIATTVGVVLQVVMVVIGHNVPAAKSMFGPGGMTISLVAGVCFAWLAGANTWSGALLGGAVAGGVCALIGIGVSYLLGDVPATLIALGSLGSAAAGAAGGAVVKFFS
ncbi:MAG: hypothetical protein E7773_14950 [Sphingomonas sp.]|uniref:hypothetical protein n=1 Tax=Sphingomonas sp. TaxID=28214 RepID=UPI0012068936|nr:hypothetical protein [Sphingomonas sp.]THD34485.1 MAG: hypothetical protein E7773_14950 [Sphingomonas sp.]